MEFSELSSTAEQQRMLVNAQGDPLKINLQAVELEGRPKLVRLLKSSGALVVSNTTEAAIILVDSATESGKRLIRTWGNDLSKVVLEHTWARTSVDAGRPLLAADNWGGAMTVDDGRPVTIDGVVIDEDELEEVEALVTKSPLPTPRVTPVDPPPRQFAQGAPETGSEPNTPAQVTGRPVAEPPVQPVHPDVVAPTLPEESEVDTHHDMQPQQTSQPPSTQPFPYTQPGLVMQQPQPQNAFAYAPFAAPPAYSSQPQMIPPQAYPPATYPPSHPPGLHVSSLPHTPLPPAQSQMMMQMPSGATSYNGVNFQGPNLATFMTIMEVMRHMSQMPIVQPPANPHSPALISQQPVTLAPATGSVPTPPASTSASLVGVSDTAFGDPYLPSAENSPRERITSSRKRRASIELPEGGSSVAKSRNKPSRRRSEEKLTPVISRKRPPAVKPTNPPPKRLRKGKERAISPESSEASEVDDLMGSDGSYPTHSSASPPAPPRTIVARKRRGELFLSDSGQPLRFFVQVDLHGRHNVVSNIKKNRGKIVNNIADADHLILFARSDTFQGLLNEALALDKIPIQSTFVTDCVEEGALLDETDYILEPVANVKGFKRGRQNAFSIKIETPTTIRSKVANPKSSAVKQVVNKSSDTPSKSKVDKKEKKTQQSVAKSSSPSKRNSNVARSSLSGTPPPPPAETRRLMKNGKYLFTELEDEYVLDLAKHHLTLDPTMSNTGFVSKLHKKMPHHTNGSWAAHVDKKLKVALDQVRKRVNIAKRKNSGDAAAPNLTQPEKPRLDPAEEDVVMSHPEQPSRREDSERQDFEVITQFFASGGGDDDDDERVWEELEKHSKCMSAGSWPEYYAAHQNEVYARIEELMNER